MQLELHHAAASLCSQKVRIVLAEKGLEWRSHHLALRNFDQVSEPFLALNPDGMVPVLVADGQPVRESTAINEFLEDAFPEPSLRPSDLLARARMRAWTFYIASEPAVAVKVASFHRLLHPQVRGTRAREEIAAVLEKMPNKTVAARWDKAYGEGFTPDEVQDSLARMHASLDRMDAALASFHWLAGDTYSLADAEMTPFVHWHFGAGEGAAVDARPRVKAWYEAVRSRPSFRAALEWRDTKAAP